jgi:multidrug efflux pump subunit AcrA (membrane-fusion protein)
MALVSSKPAAEVQAVEETQFSVRTTTVEPSPKHPQLQLIAEVDSGARPQITAALSAEVLAVHVAEGDTVQRGQLLVELDPRDAQVQLRQAQAELAQAEAARSLELEQAAVDQHSLERERQLVHISEAELARLVRLRDKGVVSDTLLDQTKDKHQRALLNLRLREQSVAAIPARKQQAQARLDAAEAALQAAELSLERTQVRAPFAAAVTEVTVEPGARVQMGQSLLGLYDTQRIEFAAEVPTRHLANLKRSLGEGDEVSGHVQFAGQSFAVQLIRLGQEARGGSVRAWLKLSEAGQIPVGIRVPLSLSLPTVKNAIALPETGLYDLNKIFRIVDGRLQSLTVSVHGSAANDPKSVIVSHAELQSGDHVLVTHLANAATGLAVRELQP